MSRVSTYLVFPGTTEAAFELYRAAFGTDYNGPVMRMGDAPPMPGAPEMSDAEKRLIMHVTLPILGGHALMGTDSLASRGHTVTMGDNVSINLEPDTRAETERLFAALAEGGSVTMPLTDMFWGGYYGQLTDRYGIKWMFNCPEPKPA